ncbi:MAG: hypothetical protein ACI92I_000023 [Acidimicrobiales bacterium]|jgi:hypothetical protein
MKTPRHTKTEQEYQEFKKNLNGDPALLESFNFDNEVVLREFEYWVIIKNRFPYDRMARTNDMLVSKQPLLNRYDATGDEQAEYETIIKLLAEENFYDAHMENFPKTRSVKKYVHVHLIQWHNTAL